jgi:hypothetical protein
MLLQKKNLSANASPPKKMGFVIALGHGRFKVPFSGQEQKI